MDVRIRAAKRAGEMLAEMAKNGQRQKPGDNQYAGGRSARLSPPTLSDLGITKNQSSDWQQLAGLEPVDVEALLPEKTGKRLVLGIAFLVIRLKFDEK